MIRFVVVNTNPLRMERMLKFLPTAEVFQGTSGPYPNKRYAEYIPQTYQRLAQHAIEQKWGRETVVLQDDVWMPHGPGFEAMNASFDAALVVYGRTDSTGLICPLSFSATPKIWLELSKVWDGTTRICDAWRPIVDTYGLVLDLVKAMGGPPSVTGRNAPCINCP